MRAWLNTSQTAPGDTVQLTLEYEGATNARPNLAPLEREFEVLGTGTSTDVQILNGSTSTRTEVTVTLSPKRTGRITIPSIAWNGERSAPLTLDVTTVSGSGPRAGGAGASVSQPVFLKSKFGPADPYVQAAVKVSVKLYTREALYNPHIALRANGDFLARRIGSDRRGTVMRDGETYEVVTRHYVLMPLRSGRLTLPGPVLEAQVAVQSAASAANNPFRGFFNSSSFGNVFPTLEPLRLQGAAIRLDVRPRPAAAVGSYWVPASAVTLKSVWHPGTLQVKADDPVTVDFSLQATGLTAAQLPDLARLIRLPTGVKSYPDAPKLTDSSHGNTVVGTRKQSIAFIADRPGRYTIPTLRIDWWDTRTNRARQATLPARTLVVLPVPGSVPPRQRAVRPFGPASPSAALSTHRPHNPVGGPPSKPSQTPGSEVAHRAPLKQRLPWIAAVVSLVLLWLGTFVAWLRLRRRVARQVEPGDSAHVHAGHTPPPPSAAAARTAFRRACEMNAPAAARRHLIAWVGAAWAGNAPKGLNALAREIDDPRIAALVRELERACYAGAPWSGEALCAALINPPKDIRKRIPRRSGATGLESLYP